MDELTKAEKEIYNLVIQGYTDSEIQSIRKTRLSTIKNQISKIYQKCGVDGSTARTKLVVEHYKGLLNES